MAIQRRKSDPTLKAALKAKAGGKCANPGCTNWRTHIHHIKKWAVYHTDNPLDMIAVCPTCHDQIHHGTLVINDDTIYRWKAQLRPSQPTSTVLFVEPAKIFEVLCGSVLLKTAGQALVAFQLSNSNRFGFRIVRIPAKMTVHSG